MTKLVVPLSVSCLPAMWMFARSVQIPWKTFFTPVQISEKKGGEKWG